jgi:hypothetical protein
MFAVVVSGSITSFPKGNKGLVVGDVKHPKTIFTLWTEEERNAIGIYTVIIDNTNFKDQTFYINTDQTYTFDSEADTVTAAYGTATAKAIADVNAVDEDGEALLDSDGNQVVIYGLKTKYKNQFNTQAAGLLLPTDWYVVKATEVSDYTVPSAITTYRAAVRTKVNAMETAIDNCANVEALITLLTYVEQEDGTVTRPLGEFPNEVI